MRNIENKHGNEINTCDIPLNSVIEVYSPTDLSFSLSAGTKFDEKLLDFDVDPKRKNSA